jgi:hypothetical protein
MDQRNVAARRNCLKHGCGDIRRRSDASSSLEAWNAWTAFTASFEHLCYYIV